MSGVPAFHVGCSAFGLLRVGLDLPGDGLGVRERCTMRAHVCYNRHWKLYILAEGTR